MSIAIRANQSGVDHAVAQKAAEKKGHQDVVTVSYTHLTLPTILRV